MNSSYREAIAETVVTFDVNIVVSEIFRLPLAADQVDDHVRVLHGLPQRIFVLQIEGLVEDLTEIAAHLERVHVVVVAPVRNEQLGAGLAHFIAYCSAQKAAGSENGGDISIETTTSSGTLS